MKRTKKDPFRLLRLAARPLFSVLAFSDDFHRFSTELVNSSSNSFDSCSCQSRSSFPYVVSVVTWFDWTGICHLTCQVHCHIYFYAWTKRVVDTPCNPGTISEKEERRESSTSNPVPVVRHLRNGVIFMWLEQVLLSRETVLLQGLPV